MPFHSLGLSPFLLERLEQMGYLIPTPIQESAIPEILRGRDLLACAQTGTGKTASFGLPLVDILVHGRKRSGLPRAIILVPTRELALQVEDNLKQYAEGQALETLSIMGGEIVGPQERKLKKGVDILIATPGRFLDLMARGRLILTDVKMVVVDEADRMFDMGFKPEVDQILDVLPRLRQTLVFSATLDAEVQRISQQYQVNPKKIRLSRSAETADTIDQYFVMTSLGQKQKTTCALLKKQKESTKEIQKGVIFCNRKQEVTILTKLLKNQGLQAEGLHGDLEQSLRQSVLLDFTEGRVHILVTTDISARGLDVSGVQWVINYDLPVQPADYVHRIGRTGRAGNKGISFSLVLASDKKKIARIESLIQKKIPFWELHPPKELSSPPPPVPSDTPMPLSPQEKKISQKSPKEQKISSTSKTASSPLTASPQKHISSEKKSPRSVPIPDPKKDLYSLPMPKPQKTQASLSPDFLFKKEMDREESIIGFGESIPQFMKNDPLTLIS